jgi:hypothetical protein
VRKFRPMLFGLALLAPAILIPVIGQTQALAVSGPPSVCLTNSYSYCTDVKDDSYVSGQPVWLYDGGKSDTFESVFKGLVSSSGPFTNSAFNRQLSGDEYGFFYAESSSNLCLIESGGNAQLGSCSGTGTLWVAEPDSDGSFLVSVLNSDSNGQLELLTAQKVSNGEALILQSSQSGWQQWGNQGSGTGIAFQGLCVPSPPCY